MRWLTILLALACANLAADERTVWGKVLSATPIMKTQSTPVDSAACMQPKPARDEGLSALLAWDLADSCRVSHRQNIAGYQVRYEWAGRQFTTRRATAPGEQIPLTVSVQLSR